MGKGGYSGGSTILRPGSNWFSYSKGKGANPGVRNASNSSPTVKRSD